MKSPIFFYNFAKGWYHYHKSKNYQLAAEGYEAALKSAPNDAKTMYKAGISNFKCARYEKAVKLMSKALELKPQMQHKWGLDLKWARGRADKANQTTKQIVQKNNAVAYINELPTMYENNLRIAFFIHVYYLDLFDEILDYILSLHTNATLIITTNATNEYSVKDKLAEKNIEAQILIVENFGYDIVPFLHALEETKSEDYDIIFKIHTKKGAANLEGVVENIEPVWRNMLLKSLIGNKDIFGKIIQAFGEFEDLSMVGCADLLKSNSYCNYGNEFFNAELLKILDISEDPLKHFGFFAGSMFAVRKKAIEPVMSNFAALRELFKQDNSMVASGASASYFHAFERIFGFLCQGKKIGLVFAKNEDRSLVSVGVFDYDGVAITKTGVGIILENELNFASNLKILENSEFDDNFYSEQYLQDDFYISPKVHFLRYGNYLFYNPNAKFSTANYYSQYPSVGINRKNAYIYSLTNNEKPKKTRKKETRFTGFTKFGTPLNSPKRVILFAGYDTEGMVDESVVKYIKELAKFGEVYYLADSVMKDEELKKLEPFCKSISSYRHGEYDWGSYKRLALCHVGYEKLKEYDEVVFTNDSIYLVRELKAVFEKMDAKNVAWWGMQATKGLYDTRNRSSNQFKQKISLEKLKNQYMQSYLKEVPFDFHIGSFFLAFRKEVVETEIFEKFLHGIKKEESKFNIILNYEVGVTKLLIENGFSFATFMDDLYPLHPVYSHHIYEMIENGFPFFKRYFITTNHYHDDSVKGWKDRLNLACKIGIDGCVDTEQIEKSILRVANATEYYNASLGSDYEELIDNDKFKELDFSGVIPIDKKVWVFSVNKYMQNLNDNLLAVFEAVKNDENITKVVLFRDKFVEFEGGKNIVCVPMFSKKAQEWLLKAKFVFSTQLTNTTIPYPMHWRRHNFISLWHGIPFKKIGGVSNDLKTHANLIANLNKIISFAVASSDVDRLAICTAFSPLKFEQILTIGIPRHDTILKDEMELPTYMQNELKKIRKLKDGRKLILFAPTFRNKDTDIKNLSEQGSYEFNEKEKEIIYEFLEKNNLILAIREHASVTSANYSRNLVHKNIINASKDDFKHIEMLYRESDLLITDYSSCFFDFMLTNKPMISFAYDLEYYTNIEHGSFYDLKDVFAGDIATNFDELIEALSRLVKANFVTLDENYQNKKRMFIKFSDGKNSERLVGFLKNKE